LGTGYAEQLLALDGIITGKSQREIAIDLFGEETVDANWYTLDWLRSKTRRRIQKAFHLLNGGYRELLEDDGKEPENSDVMIDSKDASKPLNFEL
jgi:hypothetical protein